MIIYRTVRFWAALAAAMTFTMGAALLASSPKRVSASAYTVIVGHGGPQVWGAGFIAAALFTLVCVGRRPRWLEWAIGLQVIPYAGLSVSFALASWRYPDANLTAAPVYGWIAFMHVCLANYSRIHRRLVRLDPTTVVPRLPPSNLERVFHTDFVQVLAALLAVAWVISLFVRAVYPGSTAAFAGLDTVSVTIFGYFFVRRAVRGPQSGYGGSI